MNLLCGATTENEHADMMCNKQHSDVVCKKQHSDEVTWCAISSIQTCNKQHSDMQ